MFLFFKAIDFGRYVNRSLLTIICRWLGPLSLSLYFIFSMNYSSGCADVLCYLEPFFSGLAAFNVIMQHYLFKLSLFWRNLSYPDSR